MNNACFDILPETAAMKISTHAKPRTKLLINYVNKYKTLKVTLANDFQCNVFPNINLI